MAWPRFRNPIQKLIVPTADLGLQELDFSALEFPGDVPMVLALQAYQTSQGPRIVQGLPTGTPSQAEPTLSVLQDTAARPAGSSPVFTAAHAIGVVNWIEITALGGAPTNIIYALDGSLDGGATWYKLITLTAVTAAGLVNININTGASIAVAGDIKASGSLSSVALPLNRISWTFTGGTAPTVTHKIWQLVR